MSRTTSMILAAGLACGVLSVAALAQEGRIEYTEDGRAVVVSSSPIEDVGSAGATDGPIPLPLTPGWTLEMRRQVGAVRIADLNNDGVNDLAVGCYTGSSFPPYPDWDDMIFFGGPAGLPAAPSWVSSDEIHTGDMQVGDVNGDGMMDLLAVSGGTAFSPPRVYFGQAGAAGPQTAPGWVASPPTAGWATSGHFFDVDNDGDLDLLTTNQGVTPNPYRPMYLFTNQASVGGFLSSSPSWVSAESSIQNTSVSADLDGDGFKEVAVAKWVNFASGLYNNDAAGMSTIPEWTVEASGADRGVAAGDVNGDGVVDLAFGSPDGTRVYTNTAGQLSLTYTSTPPFESTQEIALADIDLDGDLDLLEVHFGDGRTHLYLNNGGQLAPTPSWTFDATQVGNAIAVGDLNGDGRPDLAVGYSGDTSVRVFFGIAPSACYANCDASTVEPVLNVLDFNCFINRFNLGDTAANCDASTVEPVLNVLDFNCFINEFMQGCR